ncbi:hypothetical protein BpJC7_31070 [Weizmannia acidilactici]|uniref:CN hydrolase domain-containing protein n=1 Tax=Weizmannia acidilactici TaxID=2607726 RepID=A0A5J4JRR9_9BACI|nr:hypothetical protein BpJC7_31070 [Weizmannia acidilactici]
MKRKIACIQMDIAYGDPEKNFNTAEKWIEKAAAYGCDLAVPPEQWTTGYDLTRLDELEKGYAVHAIKFLSRCASNYQMDLVGGSTVHLSDGKYYNTLLIAEKDGKCSMPYSKIHLFQLMDEHRYFAPGASDGLFTLGGGTFAGVICYDIRFPEWVRKIALRGAKTLFVPAEWPLTRLDHWRTLCMARAIENQFL